MRLLPLIIAMILCGCVREKQLNGQYVESFPPFGADYWTFSPGNKFSIYSVGCTGPNIGHGHYLLDKDSIHFLFEHDTILPHRFPPKIKKVSEDSIWTIRFRLFEDTTSSPLPFAVILIKDSTDNTINACSTDMDGNAKTFVNNYRGRIKIMIKYIGMYAEQFSIDTTGLYVVEMRMFAQSEDHYPDGYTLDYKVKRLSRNELRFQFSHEELIGDRMRNRKTKVILTRVRRPGTGSLY